MDNSREVFVNGKRIKEVINTKNAYTWMKTIKGELYRVNTFEYDKQLNNSIVHLTGEKI